MFFKPEYLDERERQLRRIPELFPELVATTSVSNNIEINSVNAGKDKALLALAAHLGIPREDTVAFGDGTNDLAMIRAAGCGVAMANGHDEVKAAADLIADSCDEDGVARILETLF